MQVKRVEDDVLAYLREKIEQPQGITTEAVRWSGEDLATFAHRLDTLPDTGSWGYGLDNANGRTEVDVSSDTDAARRRIAEVIDPCAFTVR